MHLWFWPIRTESLARTTSLYCLVLGALALLLPAMGWSGPSHPGAAPPPVEGANQNRRHDDWPNDLTVLLTLDSSKTVTINVIDLAQRLDKALVQSHKAQKVILITSALHSPGKMIVAVLLSPNEAPEVARSNLLSALDQLAQNPPAAQELERASAEELTEGGWSSPPREGGVYLSMWTGPGDWQLVLLSRDSKERLRDVPFEQFKKLAERYLDGLGPHQWVLVPAQRTDAPRLADPDVRAPRETSGGTASQRNRKSTAPAQSPALLPGLLRPDIIWVLLALLVLVPAAMGAWMWRGRLRYPALKLSWQGTQSKLPSSVMPHKQAWRLYGASVTGTSHASQNLPCQDAHRERRIGDHTLILAVADGAGSAARSAEGSRCAVVASVDYLGTRLSKAVPQDAAGCGALLEEALLAARVALKTVAGTAPFSALATTLLLAVVTDRWLVTLQVGDGAIVCRLRSGKLRVLKTLNKSGYLNETTFLTSDDYEKELQRESLPSSEITGIALFTDGIERVAVRDSDNQAHGPFFAPLFDFALNPASRQEELDDFLKSQRLNDRTDDDKTLVIAARHA